MKRVHVLEFEDLGWFPGWLRTAMTNLIVVLGRVLGVAPVLANLISRILKQQGIEQIVDLGSGGGGAMPEVVARVREIRDTSGARLTMTDLYPNLDAVETFNQPNASEVRYLRDPVDATDFASAPPGLKTMVNCFHHMPPPRARAILASAHDNREPILIYEMGQNSLPFAVWLIALPLALPIVALTALLLTPFVRPLTLRQLFFTYVIPLVPIFYAWDGQASMPRIYTLEDLDELLQGLDSPAYRWEKGPAPTEKGKTLGTFLMGVPVEGARDA